MWGRISPKYYLLASGLILFVVAFLWQNLAVFFIGLIVFAAGIWLLWFLKHAEKDREKDLSLRERLEGAGRGLPAEGAFRG